MNYSTNWEAPVIVYACNDCVTRCICCCRKSLVCKELRLRAAHFWRTNVTLKRSGLLRCQHERNKAEKCKTIMCKRRPWWRHILIPCLDITAEDFWRTGLCVRELSGSERRFWSSELHFNPRIIQHNQLRNYSRRVRTRQCQHHLKLPAKTEFRISLETRVKSIHNTEMLCSATTIT